MDTELNYQALGLKIRECRRLRNLSQEKLSELCGISANYLSRVETNNGGIISLPTLVKVCNALSVSMDYMLSDSLTLADTDLLNLNALTEDDKRYITAIIKEFLKFKTNLLITLK